MKELWKTISNYPDYECSNLGKIRNKNKYYYSTYKGTLLKRKKKKLLVGEKLSQKGYLRITLEKKTHFVHRIVALTWILNLKNLPQINHKDGNKLNNAIENLEWVTNQQNRNHAVKNKLHVYGESCINSKLKIKDIVQIRNLLELGVSQQKIAKKFNVRPQTISKINLKNAGNR
jgi:DNA-binding transcriptional regulator YiaG